MRDVNQEKSDDFSHVDFISVISEDLSTQYFNGDLNLKEVMFEVKLLLDGMTQEERETLFEESDFDIHFKGHDKMDNKNRGGSENKNRNGHSKDHRPMNENK
jgi:hypothetical protein